MIEIEQLWTAIDERVQPLGEETVVLKDACGRVLAREVSSGIDQPPFDQSAVDGYAIAGSQPFQLLGSQVAGQAEGVVLEPGQAVRILTGAVVPKGTFAVIKQEDSKVENGRVEPVGEVSEGENIRLKGAVVRSGSPVLPEGTKILPGAIGLLAASGIDSVSVVRRARVLHLVTGDELVAPGGSLKSGQIFDSNGPMMAALLGQRRAGQFRQFHLGDSSEDILQTVASFEGDLLMISGGSGPGDRDHTIGALEAAGFQIHASRLNSRPGKPLIFATKGRQVAFGLPGNPLSHFVCYHAFVRRAVDRLEGVPVGGLRAAQLKGKVPEEGDGRRTWLPGILEGNEVRPIDWLHSGDLTPLAYANALILLGKSGSAEVLSLV